MQLWAFSNIGTGKTKSATPIKITIGNTLPLPNIHQYFLRPDALAGIKLIEQDYLKEGLVIPCTSPCNFPILLVKKPNGKGWRYV